MKIKFERRWLEVTNNLQVAAQVGNDPSILRDLLIFDPEIPNFVIHLDFNMNSKSLNVFLVRKDFSEADKNEADDDAAYKYKPKAIQNLYPFEETLIKRIVNNITYFLWKKAM